MRIAPVCVLAFAALLPGCSTVRGWMGLETADDPAADAAAQERDAAAAARERAASATQRSAREQAIRQEIRKLESDAKTGAVPLRESRKQIDALKVELEQVIRSDAELRATAGRDGRRPAGIEARLDRIEARLAEIERRLDASGR